MTTAAQSIKTSVSKDGRTATVSIPASFLQRSGRKQILSPPGETPWSPALRVDNALVKAVVRAHRWRQMLESGKYSSSAELAKAEKVNDSYVSHVLRLTLIAPDITLSDGAGKYAAKANRWASSSAAMDFSLNKPPYSRASGRWTIFYPS